MERRYRLGIDVGGTFTDGVLIDETSAKVYNVKVPSTPKDPSEGFISNLDSIISKSNMDSSMVWLMVHGTTIATNSIIEGKTALTALIVTRGFKDILEIAYQIRPKLYDVFVEKPAPLVPRNLCYEVTERIGADGEVIEPLEESDIFGIAKELRENKIESVAICLLHSYINDFHEKKVANVLSKKLPNLIITLSSVISPEFREYPRASTSVVNACIRPTVSSYVDKIEDGIKRRGINCGCYLMQSSGGIVSSKISKLEPARIIESGPAAGVIVAVYIAGQIGRSDALCLDIGGTTAKIGIILDGQPRISRELEVGAAAFSRSTARRASGYPLRTPSIDLVEIGAGGGSIAWVDSGGILRVGPQSAGAEPGPACYPKGGDKPTLTDANLILGRLNPEYFLGGEMKLRTSKAFEAMNRDCSKKLKTTDIQTAAGAVMVAVSNMVNAIRFVSVEKGYDPRNFCLVATGGAGPLHANLIAYELKIPSLIIPPSPGLASGLGLLISDIKHEMSATVLTLKNLDNSKLREIYKNLSVEVKKRLDKQGVKSKDIEIILSADMRYAGQSYELNVHINNVLLEEISLESIKELFHKEHKMAYGFSNPNSQVEIVSLRVTGLGKMPKYKAQQIPSGESTPNASAKNSTREVYFENLKEMIDCGIYNRKELLQNNIICGPAIIEEFDSTTLVLPDYIAKVDKWANLIISPK